MQGLPGTRRLPGTLGLLMSAAVAALLGALIGAAASIGVMWVQQKHQTKRDLLRVAAELAREDWKNRLQLLSPGAKMPPVSAFVHYHAKVLEAMANGTFSPDTVKQLSLEQEEILSAYDRANEELRKKLQKQT
jgi:hypothetical protein